MQFPNKLFSYNQSIISKLPVVLKEIKKKPCSVHDLYKKVIFKFEGINEFIEALDCLFLLGAIQYNDKEALLYVCDAL